MMTSEPPRLSTWCLERLAPRHRRESLMGDLRERYQDGRSAWWYRRQVLTTIVVGLAADVRAHTLLAVRAFLMGCAAVLLLGSFTGALRQALFRWTQLPWKSELLRQVWVYYGVPFAIISCLGFAMAGWTIARWHRDHRAAMVVLGALSPLPWALRWGWETARLLHAGLFPFWDYRVALLFQAALLFVVFPVCILIGGLWDARPDADTASSNAPLMKR
jgi:hypothetical protein